MTSRAAAPALLFLIIVGFNWRLVLTNQYTWLEHPEVASRVLPQYQFQAGEWRAGRFPLWDAYENGGESTFGQPATGAASPLNWILFHLPLRKGWLRQPYLHWYFVVLHYLGALFCYLLCRELGRSRGASLAAGAAFGCSGLFGATPLPSVMSAALWTPLVFRFLLSGRAAAAGGVLGAAILSGDPQIPLVTALAGSGLLLAQRRFASIPVFLPVALLTGSLQLLPAFETWQPAPYHADAHTSLLTGWLLSAWIPGTFFDGASFVGVTVLVLALSGLAIGLDKPSTRWFAAIGLGGVLFALGGNSVFHGALYGLLPFSRSPNPVSAIVLFQLSCVVLAALAIDKMRADVARLLARSAWILSAVLFTTLFAVAAVAPDKANAAQAAAIPALAAALLGTIVHAWQTGNISHGAAVAGLVFLMVFEAGNGASLGYPNRDIGWPWMERLAQNADLAEWLKSQPGPVRAAIDPKEVPFRFGDWHGLDTYSGPDPARYGVSYYVARAAPRAGLEEVFAGASGLKIYRDPAAASRVRVVHDNPCDARSAFQMTGRSSRSLVIEGRMACAGTVTLTENFAPGWEAVMDGSPVSVMRVENGLRGVFADPGWHRIEMRYRPASVRWGAILSGLGLLAAFLGRRIHRPANPV